MTIIEYHEASKRLRGRLYLADLTLRLFERASKTDMRKAMGAPPTAPAEEILAVIAKKNPTELAFMRELASEAIEHFVTQNRKLAPRR